MSRKHVDPDWPELSDLLAGRSLHEPPDGILRRAIALRAQLPQRQTALAWLCNLVFDSAAEPLPAGVRGAAVAERRLVYEVRHDEEPDAARQVDVRLRRERAGTIELTGQCLPAFIGATVEVRAGRTVRTVEAGTSGEFIARGVPAHSPLLITVRGGGPADLELPELPLPELDEAPEGE